MICRLQIIFPILSTIVFLHIEHSTAIDINVNTTESNEYTKDVDTARKQITTINAHGIDSNTHTIPIGEQNFFEPSNGHPAGFDFNLDDLEDVHENLKKGDLNEEDVHLLRDEGLSTKSAVPDKDFDTFSENSDNQHHVFKVSKSPKQKAMSFDVHKKDEFQKHMVHRFNSFEQQDFIVQNSPEATLNDKNGFLKVLSDLYNHYHWQPAEIRKKVSAACGVEFYSYLSALNNNVGWAERVYDSSGQNRGQFVYGNDLWLGEKLFCEEVNHHINQSDREQFAFGFSMAKILITNYPTVNQTRILNLGECLPKSCAPKDVEAILKLDPYARMFQGSSSRQGLQIEVDSVRSVPGDYIIWQDKGFYILSSAFCIMVIIAIISTIYDMYLLPSGIAHVDATMNKEPVYPQNGKNFELFQMQDVNNIPNLNNNTANIEKENTRQNNVEIKFRRVEMGIHQRELKFSKAEQILLCFSLRDNVKTILSSNNALKNPFSSIHGMRVLSLLWTMLVHTYIFLFNVGENRYRRTITERSFAFQLIANATFSVDTFFFLSGFLLAYIFLKEEKTNDQSTTSFAQKGAIRAFILLFYRYIRLTPAYLFVLFFNRIALEFVLNDSVFTPNPIDYPACEKYWWRNILYINNWYPFSEFCMHWSWYLANDMQFFLMGVILLIVSKRFFKFSATVLLVFLCTSWVTAGIISLHFNYVYQVARPFLSFDILYDKPWQRIGPYIVGMIAAYTFQKVKIPPRLPLPINFIVWLCTLGIFFSLVFGVWSGQLGLLSTAFYVGLGHTAWAVGLLWIVLSCCWGLCRPINSFLSYRGFVPLSRLTYCTYLIHPIIISIVTFHMKGPMNLQHPIILTIFLGYMVLSFTAGLVISLIFEAPMIKLSKIILRE